MTRLVSRRQLLSEMALATAVLATGCGSSRSLVPASDGSTLRTTYRDPHGVGALMVAPGESLTSRTELGPASRQVAVLATLAHLTDAHVLDAQSPARVTFLNRLGPPFQSTFRPHETLTSQVLAGAARAIDALAPDAVIQGGDLIDNDQSNELELALAVLNGEHATPGSGPPGYFGVQSPFDADPFYYRPDLDAPRHPGLLEAATRPFRSGGLHCRCYPVLGDHDLLVAGEIAPTAATRALATGSRAVWDLPAGLTFPPGLSRQGATAADAGYSPDGPPGPGVVQTFLKQAMAAPAVRVPPDLRRRQLDPAEVLDSLRARSPVPTAGRLLDYSADVGPAVRLLVLDLARRGGGSGGLVHAGQAQWLASELAAAGERWIVVVSHQPLASSEGGNEILALLDRNPRVIAAISGHTHRNRVVARATAAGGYWLLSTASLIDYPQQTRALRIIATEGGGVAIETWMLDHVFPGELGTISRQLAYLDSQGGRPEGFGGRQTDRNVRLYLARGRR